MSVAIGAHRLNSCLSFACTRDSLPEGAGASRAQDSFGRACDAPGPPTTTMTRPGVPVCTKCSCARDTPSPLDPSKRRSWAPGSKATTCAWCEALEDIIAATSGKARGSLSSIKPSTPEWSILLQAMFTLRLEGISDLAGADLLARCGILQSVGFGSGSTFSTASSASTRSAAKSSSSSSLAASRVTPQKRKPADMLPPGKQSAEASSATSLQVKSEDGCSVATSAEGSPLAASKAPGSSRAPRKPAAASSSDDDGADIDDDIDDDMDADAAQPVAIPPMSLDEKFPQSHDGNCVSRMTMTINNYVLRMEELDWATDFKIATITALNRRFCKHRGAIEATMHIESIAAFKALRRRLQHILQLWRAVVQWKASQNDMHLEVILKHMKGLDGVLEYYNTAFAGDLSIVRAQAEFQSELSKSNMVCEVASRKIMLICHTEADS